jgi:hypothetical protein
MFSINQFPPKNYFFSRFNSCADELKISEFFEAASETLRQVLQDTQIKEIICLGIGRISNCSIARHQLAFISLIGTQLGISISFFDPVLSNSDKEILKALNYEILSQNKEGSYLVQQSTLFYLPHCPKQITNNLLFSNWTPDQLSKVFLICNSFKTIIETTPERILRPNAHFILEISPFAEEKKIENNFRFTDIFNDFAIINFPSEKLEKAAKSFWSDRLEPKYSEEDLELVRNGSD